MRAQYDFSRGKRAVSVPLRGKTRISIFIDDAVLGEFRARAEKAGTGYQTMMNEALKTYLAETDRLVTEKVLRQVLRQEMPAYLSGPQGRQAAAKTGGGALQIPAKKIAALCRKYGVRKLSLFGSAARSEMTSGSDVDLLVEFKPESKVSLWDIPQMQKDFSSAFGNRTVDIVPPNVLRNPHRRRAILPDLKLLYEA